MLYVDITEDNKYLVVRSGEKTELAQLKISFTSELPNAFILKKRCPWVSTTRCFMNDYGMIPSNCWFILLSICKEHNIQIDLSQNLKS